MSSNSIIGYVYMSGVVVFSIIVRPSFFGGLLGVIILSGLN